MTITLFDDNDLARLASRGIPAESAARQLELLRNPPPAIQLERPCRVGDGIVRIAADEETRFISYGDAAAARSRILKFVPASGAATRMFKDLISALADAGRRPSDSPAARQFFERLDSFPFAAELRRRANVAGTPRDDAQERRLLRVLLEEMRYALLPKGLIPFHRDGEGVKTAFEEHLHEGARFARDDAGVVRMHFTVSPEFRSEFEVALADAETKVTRMRRGSRLDVGFSEQHPSTDTLAADAAGDAFRGSDGALLFRPGGHGALIRNLNALRGDIVVIKNIDNILPDRENGEVVRWKRILTGYLVNVQREVFEMLEACAADDASAVTLDRGIALATLRFARQPETRLETIEEKRAFVMDALDRPIRICGVVRNEGEPGGAPFWVRERSGGRSVQIVESAQVDMSDPAQVSVWNSSTHFNPVDIVCGVTSWRGEPFDLARFVDDDAVFLSHKSYEGRDLRALELPGLWNGAMARWNTVCVEVPAATFAPVKTVFDLLRPQHQVRAAAPAPEHADAPAGRVLIVEDNAVNARVLEQIIRSGGLDSLVAPEGERAIELLARERPDLVLLDIVLPGLDGYEVLERIRASEVGRDTPVIFISSLDETGDKIRGLSLGAADYVTKPFNRDEVLARVRAQLRIRQLSASLEATNRELVERQETMSEDLRVAADIQRALLPARDLALPGFRLGTLFQPSLEIGGDLFSVAVHDGPSVSAFIGDVSGHGVASALVSVSVHQRLAGPAGLIEASASPAAVMQALDLEYPFERFEKYLSLFLVSVDAATGRFRYSSAGHPSPFVVRADGSVERLSSGGPVLGMGFGLPFEEGVGEMKRGDRLVLYTDGVTDDESSAGEVFGLERLVNFFIEGRSSDLVDLCAELPRHLAARRGDAPPGDDIALLVLEKR